MKLTQIEPTIEPTKILTRVMGFTTRPGYGEGTSTSMLVASDCLGPTRTGRKLTPKLTKHGIKWVISSSSPAPATDGSCECVAGLQAPLEMLLIVICIEYLIMI